MGILEILTIVFIVLKLTDAIAWSWWVVFLPMIVTYGVAIILLLIIAAIKIAKGETL